MWLSENMGQTDGYNPRMFHRRKAAVRRKRMHVEGLKQAVNVNLMCTIVDRMPFIHTSWMFGNSSSSAKIKTPEAEVASWMSLAAAAPLADLDMSKNGSSRAAELPSSTMGRRVSIQSCGVRNVAAALPTMYLHFGH